MNASVFVPARGCRLPFILSALSLAIAAPAFAAEPADVELAPGVVTAVQQSSPLTVIADPKDARQPVPASDATDYLKTIPGFSAIRSGGTNGDPVLRGMFGSRINLRTNGGLMLGACPGRMDAPSSYISPETYDQLTVIKGPQTVLWGPGASAGTVLFERRPERFGELGTRLHASLLTGSNGRFDKVLDAAAGGEQGYLRFAGNQAQSDDYEDGDGDTVPSRWKKWNGDLAIGWTPDADTLLELSAGKGDGEARYAGRGMDGAQFARESLGLRFAKDNLGGVLDKVEAQVYYNYADHIMDNFSLRDPDPSSMMPMPMASQVDRRTTGARVAATFAWSEVELVAGVDALRSEHRARASRYRMPMMGQPAQYTDADQFPWTKDSVMHNYGAFAELTWQAAERSRVIGGARLDRADATDYRQTVTQMSMVQANPTAGEQRSDTLPSGFARYEYDLADSPTTLYAGIGHVQRFPDYWELFSPKRAPEGEINAFAGIEPEKTTQLDFGVQYAGEDLQAWASGYVGQVRDYILFSYSRNMMGSLVSQADNIDARIMGGELGVAYDLTDTWKTDATLAYAWGKNSSDGEALPQMPPLEARLGLTYERESWSAGALWRVVAQQNRVDEGKGNVVGRDIGKSAGFGVFSLNGAYRVSEQVKLSAGVDNLFDKDYAEHLNLAGNAGFGYPADPVAIDEPGRTLWTKVEFDF
ncbi:TonB-dependent copper receptor [Aquipseudomonas alcaligenes]|uniref:TonB-dependent copper receptor n=1 Tax=Aquipseudomonas alcaligenes (strain ATCC 14909 / DSM 50342 / CCUG 1425 / JCM 20561 / NBRC 14159 / NCIMB 9945 / NCTC 10367 / 1577) TaxID=1215092 RepID=U3BDZ5_AQUA1|nr:TonB-dependent copper receptor [Pseudomonas alcaligenes]GAD64998.1 TonB-dependent copper receptor [Pseudomonas alcaligenes NBRC 14159]SUD19396.1 Putative copper transport outer membrane porin OprC [Pseudomonas alcaligenes]